MPPEEEAERRPEFEDSFPVSKEALQFAEEEEEEPPLFAEKGPENLLKSIDERGGWEAEDKAEEKMFQRGRTVRRKKRGPFSSLRTFCRVGSLDLRCLLPLGGIGVGQQLAKVVEDPIKKVTGLWDTLWKTEREGLVIGDLNAYEEKVGEDFPLRH